MKIIHVGADGGSSSTELNAAIAAGKPVFVLFYMEGCGPCNATRPEWAKLEGALGDQTAAAVIADVNQTALSKIRGPVAENVAGFPTMRYVRGATMEDYSGGRTVDELAAWIRGKTAASKGGRSRARRGGRRRGRTCRRRRTRYRRRMSRFI